MSFRERFEWSIKMQESHAIELYESYFDIEEIIEVDKEGDSHRALKVMDFSGIDKIAVVKPGYQVQIAQRFRREYHDSEDGWTAPDFSLRVESYNDGASEYDKLVAAHEGHGSIPNLYGFGRAPYGRQVALGKGFNEFYLINLPHFLNQHLSGEIEILERAPNGDGSAAVYFDLQELWSHDCIVNSWGVIPPSSDPGKITAYTDGGEDA